MAKTAKIKYSQAGIRVQGTLTVDGATTFAGALSGTTLSASGAATLSSTLAVTGATTLGSDLVISGASGSAVTVKTKTVTMDLSASHTAVGFIPANCVVLSLTARVLTTLSGDSTFDGSTWELGDTDADKWGAGLALAAGTTVTAADWTAGDPAAFASATDVEFGETAGTANAGTIRLVLHYLDITAPTA